MKHHRARVLLVDNSRPPRSEAQAFLARVPNVCIELPFDDAEALDLLAVGRALAKTTLMPRVSR
jgi:hypothetical protein